MVTKWYQWSSQSATRQPGGSFTGCEWTLSQTIRWDMTGWPAPPPNRNQPTPSSFTLRAVLLTSAPFFRRACQTALVTKRVSLTRPYSMESLLIMAGIGWLMVNKSVAMVEDLETVIKKLVGHLSIYQTNQLLRWPLCPYNHSTNGGQSMNHSTIDSCALRIISPPAPPQRGHSALQSAVVTNHLQLVPWQRSLAAWKRLVWPTWQPRNQDIQVMMLGC